MNSFFCFLIIAIIALSPYVFSAPAPEIMRSIYPDYFKNSGRAFEPIRVTSQTPSAQVSSQNDKKVDFKEKDGVLNGRKGGYSSGTRSFRGM